MDHPSVARIYDGGTTSTGRPFIAMEYVPGDPITAYCDRARLTVRARLQLFVQVCEAVHHAHMKGIIHRDIKPSNILIKVTDGQPLPKVIDFGVSKALSHTLTDKTIFTVHGQLIGTPEYMSPEQAEMGAVDIDTRADVYSLGVVLYELMAGLLPFDSAHLRQVGYAEIQRIIREVDPPRPSYRLLSAEAEMAGHIAARRAGTLEGLRNELRRELEWIPLRAMRKDRTQRYASAQELADDIKAYLRGAPLRAAPLSRFYLTKKFVRRNSVPIAFAILSALLIGALVVILLLLKKLNSAT
jgi:serine/threonine protein kinase